VTSTVETATEIRRTGASFDELKQIEAGVLNVGYAEAGPSSGPAVLLLHGWPYDIHSYLEVAPLLAAEGVPGDHPALARLRHHALPFE
jgi:pimeloyl-ACP methyl ester carboxylesterase